MSAIETSETIERVARAIAGERGNRDPTQQDYRMARAAIEEIRKPTPEMIEAGFTHGIAGYGEASSGDAARVWLAMVDSALGKKS